jgi:hypothetical protein
MITPTVRFLSPKPTYTLPKLKQDVNIQFRVVVLCWMRIWVGRTLPDATFGTAAEPHSRLLHCNSMLTAYWAWLRMKAKPLRSRSESVLA